MKLPPYLNPKNLRPILLVANIPTPDAICGCSFCTSLSTFLPLYIINEIKLINNEYIVFTCIIESKMNDIVGHKVEIARET